MPVAKAVVGAQESREGSFWIEPRGTIRTVGRPSTAWGADKIAVVMLPGAYPQHIFTMMEFVWSSGHWGRLAKQEGSQWVITAADVNNFLGCLEGPGDARAALAYSSETEQPVFCPVPPEPAIQTPEEKATKPYVGFMMGAVSALSVLALLKYARS